MLLVLHGGFTVELLCGIWNLLQILIDWVKVEQENRLMYHCDACITFL